jgi:ATP-dependent helicase STH1/SNF2
MISKRRRADMDGQDYPDYFEIIQHPIALSTLRKRAQSNYYKDVQSYRNDFKLMFQNAKTYNQEGSWVYVDAQEMERVFEEKFFEVMAGSGLPGAPAGGGSSFDDDRGASQAQSRNRAVSNRRQIVSDDEFLTPSDEE